MKSKVRVGTELGGEIKREKKNPTVILFAFEKQLSEQQTLRKQVKAVKLCATGWGESAS